jgi:type I restriction enzyme, S subunit
VTLRVHPNEIVARSASGLLAAHPSWARVPLNEIADVLNGFAFKSSYFSKSDGVPLLRIRDVGQPTTQAFYTGPYDGSYLVRRGELVVGMDGDFRAARWSGEDAVLNQRVCKITVRDEKLYSADFLSHVLQGYLDAINAHTSSITVKHLSSRTIQEIPLPLPPPNEQRRIVAAIEEHLSRLDAAEGGVLRTRFQLGKLEASVLTAAVQGRLQPQDPEDEPARELLERALETRRAAFKGKTYREPAEPSLTDPSSLPAGWVWASFEQVSARVTVGHVGPMKHEYVEDGVPFIRSQNVRENRFDRSGLKFIGAGFHEKLSKSKVIPGDLLVVRSGSVGAACVAPAWLGEANCSDLVIIQRPTAIVPEFGAYYLNSVAKRAVRSGTVGVALAHFNTRSVAELPIPVPPLEEQRRIVSEVERRFSVVDAMRTTIDAVARRTGTLRRSILEHAFRGELVQQDPHDEPASVLLERIRTEHAAIQKQSRRRRVNA